MTANIHDDLLNEKLNITITAEAMRAFEAGLAAGMRIASGLIQKRVDGANRVVGTSRLYDDAICIRDAATMFEKGQGELATSSLAQRFGQ